MRIKTINLRIACLRIDSKRPLLCFLLLLLVIRFIANEDTIDSKSLQTCMRKVDEEDFTIV